MSDQPHNPWATFEDAVRASMTAAAARTPPAQPIDLSAIPANVWHDIDFTVEKRGTIMHISDELAMDEGLIPDTRPPAPPPTLRRRIRRARWAVGRRFNAARWWLGCKIAGADLDHDCGY